jgi:hypothetical protein
MEIQKSFQSHFKLFCVMGQMLGGCSVGIVRSRTQTMEFSLVHGTNALLEPVVY